MPSKRASPFGGAPKTMTLQAAPRIVERLTHLLLVRRPEGFGCLRRPSSRSSRNSVASHRSGASRRKARRSCRQRAPPRRRQHGVGRDVHPDVPSGRRTRPRANLRRSGNRACSRASAGSARLSRRTTRHDRNPSPPSAAASGRLAASTASETAHSQARGGVPNRWLANRPARPSLTRAFAERRAVTRPGHAQAVMHLVHHRPANVSRAQGRREVGIVGIQVSQTRVGRWAWAVVPRLRDDRVGIAIHHDVQGRRGQRAGDGVAGDGDLRRNRLAPGPQIARGLKPITCQDIATPTLGSRSSQSRHR